MKKFTKRFLSIFLCLLMVSGTIAQTPLTAQATETVSVSLSENEISILETIETEPAENTVPETAVSGNDAPEEPALISFYDDDDTTLLYSISVDNNGAGFHLNQYLGNIYEIPTLKKGYPLYKWDCPQRGKDYRTEYIYSTMTFKKSHTFFAIWDDIPYNYNINYQLNGGSFSHLASGYPTTFNVESPAITLPIPQRAGYQFGGWYKDASFQTAVNVIPAGTYFDKDKSGNIPSYNVYAKWISVTSGRVAKPKAVHSAKGKIKVTFGAISGVQGYEITYATNKKFTKNKLTRDLGQKTSYTLSNLPTGKKYYFKVRAYATDSTGNKCYGKYSPVVSCKVKKGVKEYTAKKTSGKLQKVIVKNSNDLYVQAKVSKRLKSSDGFYYLVKVDPNTGKVLKQIAKTDKTKTVKFTLPLRDEKGTNHTQGKFGVAVKKGKKYMLISSTSFINNPEAAAKNTAPFPTPASKKGRQGRYDASMGDKNYFFNFNINKIIATQGSHQVAYKYNGKTYYFNNPGFSETVKAINRDGGTVTIQVMMQWNENSKDLILKSGRYAPVPGREGSTYYAFNTDAKAAREKLEAAFHYLAEYAGKEDCHIDNWIIGNEVNTYENPNAKWYYAGNLSREKFIKNYASTYRMLYYAVKSNYKNGRVYICCDHTWINREQDWGTKYFTSAFHKEIKSQNKNIKWNLAYHAYSAVLTNADFWNDGRLAPNNENADFVSPNNLNILTDYVKKNFGSEVRIILSEQGFSCSGGVGSPYNVGRQTGEGVQAAAVAYLYYKAQFNDMIDAVIFSSGDHGGAGYQFDFMGRQAEDTYRYMDTPKYASYTSMHLSTIKQSSWKKAVPGFDDSKLKSMPNR